jgi:hypothetical protein
MRCCVSQCRAGFDAAVMAFARTSEERALVPLDGAPLLIALVEVGRKLWVAPSTSRLVAQAVPKHRTASSAVG